MDLRKNDIVKGEIIDINDDAQGILKTNNNVIVFVPNALPGEQITASIINTKSKFAIGKILSIEKESLSRINPACPYFNKCGGCDIMHANKAFQLKFKTDKVKNNFKKFGNLDVDVKPCISLNDLRYRNKIALPISVNGEIGLYRKNSHSVLPITDCLITEEWNNKLVQAISKYITESQISIFNETNNIGCLKHIVARKINNSILVTLVVANNKIPKPELLINILKSSFDSFGLNLNINTFNNNVILGDKWEHLFGLEWLISDEFGITYPVSNASFFQVNNAIKTAIYEKVLSLIPSDAAVIDAYSGTGLLSGIIAKKAKTCYGVEIIKEATQNANELKKKNKLTNLENINGDCAVVIPKLVKSINSNNLILTLDPPRKGCDKKVLDSIIKSKPNSIIYISCDPATLARDAKIITANNNYRIELIQPYDMFPNTKHVETLCVFKLIQ